MCVPIPPLPFTLAPQWIFAGPGPYVYVTIAAPNLLVILSFSLALSDVDCFHPSAATHARVGAEAFNRMPLTKAEKVTTFVYNSAVQIRCLQETDRISTTNEL